LFFHGGNPMRRHEVSDETWEVIAPLLPGKKGDPGRTGRNNRKFVNAVFWLAKTGAPWRDLPERFGKWNSVFRRFRRWADKGVWERVLEAISEDEQYDLLLVDSSIIRAHQHAAGGKKGALEKRWADREEALVQRFMQQLANSVTLSK